MPEHEAPDPLARPLDPLLSRLAPEGGASLEAAARLCREACAERLWNQGRFEALWELLRPEAAAGSARTKSFSVAAAISMRCLVVLS
jgi:hypothetical protein